MTTEVYLEADPAEKLEAIGALMPPQLRKGSFCPGDKLLALLRESATAEQKENRRARPPG
jgi:hypothetical protein